jgi:hypothetical protein
MPVLLRSLRIVFMGLFFLAQGSITASETGIYGASLLLAALGHAGAVHLEVKVAP